jgi:siroheme synthase
MGMASRAEIAAGLLGGGLPATTPVAVVHWGTPARQRVVRSTLGGLVDVDLAAPATIVVGDVAAVDLGSTAPGDPG